jgi:hypothetical protein
MIVAFLIHCWCGKPFNFCLGGQQTRSGVSDAARLHDPSGQGYGFKGHIWGDAYVKSNKNNDLQGYRNAVNRCNYFNIRLLSML